MGITPPLVLLGAASGLTYGLLAVGLILVFRSSGIINFAQGGIGALAAACLGIWVIDTGLPYWLVFPIVLAIGALASVLTEIVVVRRLRAAPAVMTIVATLGMAGFLTGVSLGINTFIRSGSQYPLPPGLPSFDVGPLVVTSAYTAQLIGSPLIAIGLTLFLRYSRYGIAIRAAAANPTTARMSGISPGRMSAMVWGIAGAIAAYGAVMRFPSQGLLSLEASSISPGLLIRALLIAVVARMTSLLVALFAGVVLGIIEQFVLWYTTASGQIEILLFGAVFVALLAQRRPTSRERDHRSWLSIQAWKTPPAALANLWAVRRLGYLGVAMLCLALVAVYFTSHSNALVVTRILAISLVGMSVFITTGLTGQLSLGQFALAGVGAIFSYHITSRGIDFGLGVLLAAVLTATVAIALGVTSLRIKGLMLTVTTLAFAVMAHAWLFQQTWAMPRSAPGRPVYFGIALDSSKLYMIFAAVVFLVGLWVVANVNRGGLRRQFVALRDNEDGARAFSVRATKSKLEAFAVAGFLAGLGGAVYGHSLPNLSHLSFGPEMSILVVAMSVIGGLSFMAGPLVGALYLIGLPHFVALDAAATATSTLGWLLLILYFPGGLAQVIAPLRDQLIRGIGRLHGIRAESDTGPPQNADKPEEDANVLTNVQVVDAQPRSSRVSAIELLKVQNLSRSFGGVRAVDDVSFSVKKGEILGLIGPNGAGKTTLFEIIGGFNKPDHGTVVFDGKDVTRMSPEDRCVNGIVRSFQDARLFPTMTVLDVARLATERTDPTGFMTSIVAWPAAGRKEEAKNKRALELIELMGLSRYRDTRISELSTGTRRVAELACIVAMEPELLLLDEPSSGIAQRETEALGSLIKRLCSQLDTTVIIIEHDMPLIASISDRILAMDNGRMVAIGDPDEVISHPEVVASYLGTDTRAVARSGLAAE